MAPRRSIPANDDASSSSDEEQVQLTGEEEVEEEEEEEEEVTEEEEEEGEAEEEEEEEDDDDEEEEEEQKEQKQQLQQQKKHKTQSIEREEAKKHDDDDDDDDDEDDNEDEGEEKQQAAFESILSNEESHAVRSTAAPSKSSKRRVAAEDVNQRKKKLRSEASDANEDHDRVQESDKKPSFHRLWSLEDECILLKALIDFKKKDLDPLTNINAFYDFIKHSIHVEPTLQQLKRKIRGLKDKYKTNARRVRGNETPNFPKPQDLEMYKLSKKIWNDNGQDDDSEDNVDANNKLLDSASVPERSINNDTHKDHNSTSPVQPKVLFSPEVQPKALFSPEVKSKLEHNGKEELQVSTEYLCLTESMKPRENWSMLLPGLGGSLIKEGFSLLGRSKAKELDRNFRKLQIKELELYLDRIDLARKQTELILDALKKSV